ncbi:UNVERIFIED_ORG: hypothetical protein J3D59_002603 [Pseudomonas fluorescens]
MAVLKVEGLEFSLFLNKLSCVVDFEKDLPKNIYFAENLSFWFFERPLLDFHELFLGLISESFCSFESHVFIKFSGGEQLAGSCFSIDETDASKDVCWIAKGFGDFFRGTVGYPIIICNGRFDWLAYESASEEYGVIALRGVDRKTSLYDYLNANFISLDELAEWEAGSLAESVIAKALISSYRR